MIPLHVFVHGSVTGISSSKPPPLVSAGSPESAIILMTELYTNGSHLEFMLQLLTE